MIQIIKLKIPKIRFKEFSGEWKEKSIKNITSLLKDGTHGTHSDSIGSDYLLLSAKNIKNGSIIIDDTDRKISKIDYDSIYKNYNLNNGDILLSIVGTIGRTAIYKGQEKIAFQRSVAFFRFKEDNYNFVYHYFNTNKFQNELDKRKVVSAQPGIYLGDLAKIKINLPSLLEQQKIALFLSSVDEKIENIKEKKKNLEEYKKGVMQKIFSQEIRFKDENGEEFEEWEEKKLGVICKLQGGFAVKSNEFKKSGIPIIRISNISNNNNYIDLSNLVYYDEINNDENYIINKGDLIIAMSGATTGKSSIYNLEEKAYLNQRVGLFKANLNKLNYGFLIQFVFSDLFYKQLDGVLVAGAQPNISGKDIENFNIFLPSLPEQQKIADFLSSIDEKIEKVSEELVKMEEFKKGLLQGMFV